jgi:alpha-D-ribose 1-methylphosphonate 5-triphosphate synthase subunit PhnL
MQIDVFRDICFDAYGGECLSLDGPSGTGKSTLLRSLYANYSVNAGQILVEHSGYRIDIAGAEACDILEFRRDIASYVSQFLRAIPRVSALDVVAERAIDSGCSVTDGYEAASELLTRLHIRKELWNLSPLTFSGGEQQRVNIARGFIASHPILLLDEPTASLDGPNRRAVIQLIKEAKARGQLIIGIFHDDEVRRSVTDKLFSMNG